MKGLSPLLLALLLSFSSLSLFAQREEEQLPISTLLQRLDQAIEHKLEYQALRSQRADSLRLVAQHSQGMKRVNTLHQIYEIYLNFKTDSSLNTLHQLSLEPEVQNDPSLYWRCHMDVARVYGLMGFYHRAFAILDSVPYLSYDNDLRLHYYNVMHSILGWRADYALKTAPDQAPDLLAEAAIWHDSLLICEPIANNRTIISTNRAYDYGDYQHCIDTLLCLIDRYDPRQRTFAYSRLSQAYGKTGQAALQLRYLILTSIDDIRSGITEYMALPELALQLYNMGEIDRAYAYLVCALEDANTCHSNLRTIEVSTIYPIVSHAHQQLMEHERQQQRVLNIVLIIAAIFLIGVILILIRFTTKLNTTRSLLATANGELKKSNYQLQNVNRQLLLSDRNKGDYLMNYLSRSHTYLSTIESIQRQTLKLLQSKQIAELTRKLKSTDFIEVELEKFYADFDSVFLSLYPNFVEKFNSLLRPDCAILPRSGELLTTELRIFALIRMGETDSTRIAKFLNYSPTTIYNYRSRVRNNALGDKNTFEDEVMKL